MQQTDPSDAIAAALRASEARLSSVLATAMDAIVTVDEAQNVLGFNPSAERLFGHAVADVLGRSLDRLVPARVRAQHAADVARFGQSGASVRSMGGTRVVCAHASGREFPAEARISRAEVDGRHFTTIALRDLTPLDHAEDVSDGLATQLRHAQRVTALGTLAGGVAHEINNVLMRILSNAALAATEAPHAAGLAQPLEEICRACKAGASIVKPILAFIQKRDGLDEFRVLELAPLARETARVLRALLPPNVSIELEVDPTTPTVRAAAVQIEQVIVNLCTNAWHALGEGPGLVELSVERALVAPESAAARRGLSPGEYARIRVVDRGCGMDRQTLERAFEAFFTTKPNGEGTGLGLAVVRGIVTSHGGAIFAESEPAVGSTFDVYLPRADAPAEAASAAKPSGTSTRARSWLLVVDAEAEDALAMARPLERLGYSVVTAVDTTTALDALQARHHELALVLVDPTLLPADGLELARVAARLDRELPVVVATSFATPEFAARAVAAGVREVLAKPLDGRRLLDSIARHARVAPPLH
jgi:PAS domain S-box-containing protein